MSILRIILLLFRALFRDRSQLAILHHTAPRARLRRADRAFWVSLARVGRIGNLVLQGFPWVAGQSFRPPEWKKMAVLKFAKLLKP